MSAAVRPPTALTVAGSDSSGGAGIAADLKCFEVHGVWGLVAVAAVTAQSSRGVRAWEAVSPELVVAQVEAVAEDVGVDAAKTGMLGTAAVVEAVAGVLARLRISPLVVDPVLASTRGDPLLHPGAVSALRTRLLPLATLVTPNLHEAAVLAGLDGVRSRHEVEEAGRRILELGPGAVLVTGGHLEGDGADDCLVTREGVRWIGGDRVTGAHTHGTGCVLSAAVAARLARGDELQAAVEGAKAFVSAAIREGLPLGTDGGPVNPGVVLGAGRTRRRC